MEGCNRVYKWSSKMETTCLGVVDVILLTAIHTPKLKYLQSVRSRLKCFWRGASRYWQKIKPTKGAILRAAIQVHPSPTESKHTPIFSAALHGRLSEEQLAVNDALKSFLSGGSGIVDDRKPTDIFRLMDKNMNSLCLYDEMRCHEKVNRCGRSINAFRQTWPYLMNLALISVKSPRIRVWICCWETTTWCQQTTEPSACFRYGGVGALAYPSGKDPTGLGRWVWFLVSTGDQKTIIVVAYSPVKQLKAVRLSFDQSRKTVWSQHVWLFLKHGLTGSPLQRFIWDLTAQLLDWKKSGYEVVHFGVFYEHVYEGKMAKRLGQDDLLMTEAFKTANGFETPASYFRGSTPITGCFTTQGIDVVNV